MFFADGFSLFLFLRYGLFLRKRCPVWKFTCYSTWRRRPPGLPEVLFSLFTGGLVDVTRRTLAGDQGKVDFPLVHVDRFHTDFHAVARAIGLAAGLTNKDAAWSKR